MDHQTDKAGNRSIIVIGAGIAGISTAIWLQRAGKKVLVLDRGQAGMGTSYGNGGVLASCAMVPVTSPGLRGKGPRLLLDRDFPLFLRWSYLPRLYPWLRKYLAHANDADTRRIAKGLTQITGDSVEQHQALAGGTAAARYLVRGDYTFAYADRAAFRADAYAWALRAEAGFIPELVEGPAVQEYEPALGSATGLLAVMRGHGHITAPGAYVQALADEMRKNGGELRQAEVSDFELTDGRITAVITDQGRMACDTAVLTTGVWSKPLMKKLGLNIPLESERGYHVVFTNPSIKLRQPLMIAAGKFVATPMEGGLRCAGIVEFGGLKAGPSRAPLAFMYRKVKESFPDLRYERTEEWLGHRPAPADSLPLIGEIGQTGIFTGVGHHHIGLTGGPKTGRILADLIAQNRNNTDFGAFSPMRFT